jgi:PAS domain S-box-containing protein
MKKKNYKSIDGKAQVLLGLLSDPAVIIDQKGLFLIVNDDFGKVTGLKPEELIGKSFLNLDITDAKNKAVLLENLRKRLHGIPVAPYEMEFTNATGEKRLVEVKGKRINFTGQPASIVVLHDITRRKENARRLKEYAEKMTVLVEEKVREIKDSEEKFRNLADQSPNMVFVNKKGRVVYANKKAEEVTGYTKEEFYSPSFNFLCLIAPESRELVKSAYEKHLKNGKDIGSLDYKLITKDGRVLNVMLSSRLIMYEGDNAILGTVIDITERKQLEEALRGSEEKLGRIFGSSPDPIVVSSSDAKVLDCNPAALKTFGYSTKSEVIDRNVFEFFAETERARGAENLAREGENARNIEYIFQAKNGREFVGELSISPVFQPSGKITCFVSTIKDLTERREKEKALRESEERFKQVAENAEEWIWEVDAHGMYTYSSPLVEKILGYKPEEIVGKKRFYDLFHPENREQLMNTALKLFKQKQPIHDFINKNMHSNGEAVWLSTSGVPILDQQGKLVGYRGTDTNITERKKAEENLEKSEKEKSAVLNSMSELVIHQDLKHRVLWVNRKAANSVNMNDEQLRGRYCHELWAKSVNPCTACPIEETIKKGQPQQGEITTPDGRVWSISGYPIKDANGNVTSAVEVTTEITEKKKAEEALRESEAKYRELINGMNDTAWVIDLDAKFIDVNDAAVKVLGYSKEELLSMGPADIDNSLSAEEISKLVKNMPADQIQVFETAHTTKDGKKIPVEISSSLVTYQGKQAVLSIARNITERKEMEQALSKSEVKYRKLFEESNDAIFVADAKTGIILDCNHRATELTGKSRSELIGQHQRTLHPQKETEVDFSRTLKMHIREKRSKLLNSQVVMKSGEIRDVSITAGVADLEGRKVVLVSFRDITEERKMQSQLAEYSMRLEQLVEERTNQLKEAQHKLVKSERLAAIGELAGMVGHDLRNPLTGIKNAAYYLKVKQDSSSADKKQKMLEVIDSAISRADKIINDLLDYSREINLELAHCSPQSILKEALSSMQIPNRITIEDETLEKPDIKADKDRIVRVFINLIKNAVDAMPEGGTLQIKSIQTDANIKISFADTGIGISKEVLSKLFLPLVTTKAQGMGFGLAICKRIVEAHGGEITVKSVLGKGATFTVILPIEPESNVGGETTWVNLPESLLSTMTKT